MPRLHPDDSKRLTNLHRCYSCACVRHISMHFQIFDANILINLAPLDSQSRILAPPPRDAPRARITTQKFLVCVFCRRDLLSHTAPPKPPRSRPLEPVPEWEPNPDYPGDCDSPDDSDDLDYIEASTDSEGQGHPYHRGKAGRSPRGLIKEGKGDGVISALGKVRDVAPPPRDAPRARITTQKFLVCVFCRRDLLSHTAPPKPPRSRPLEPVPEWEPNPDYPGDCDSPDDSDDLDYIGQGAQW